MMNKQCVIHFTKAKLLALLLIAFTPIIAQASERDTANFYKAHQDAYAGNTVSLEVVTLQLVPMNIGEQYVLLNAQTSDDGSLSNGGSILVVAPRSQRKALLQQYQAPNDNDGQPNPTSQQLQGILQSIPDTDTASTLAYIDLTNGQFQPNRAFYQGYQMQEREDFQEEQ